MSIDQLRKFGTKFAKEFGKRSPVILITLGIGSGIAAIPLTVKATLKASELIEEEKCARVERDESEEMTAVEVVKTAWKPFVPVAATSVFSVACLIGSFSVHSRRNAALAAAYKISETALANFKDAAIEELGEKKVTEIKKKASTKHMEDTPYKSTEVVMIGNGTVLCYDDISGRYFKSDRETIRAAVNDCNYQLQNEMFISLNDFYEKIGLPYTSYGSKAGWNIDQYPFEVLFDSKIADDGTPCMVISYNIEPRINYHEY